MAALAEVVKERIRQDVQWGGPEHDDEHGLGDWMSFVSRQLDLMSDEVRARMAERPLDENEEQRSVARARLIKIAALAVAAVESIDRKSSQ